VAIAAASLGWNTCMLDGYSGHELESLLGLPQLRPSIDRGPVKGVMRDLEAEHADCVIAVFPSGKFYGHTVEFIAITHSTTPHVLLEIDLSKCFYAPFLLGIPEGSLCFM